MDVSRCPRKCQDEEKGSHAEIKSAAYVCIILMVECWKKGSNVHECGRSRVR